MYLFVYFLQGGIKCINAQLVKKQALIRLSVTIAQKYIAPTEAAKVYPAMLSNKIIKLMAHSANLVKKREL